MDSSFLNAISETLFDPYKLYYSIVGILGLMMIFKTFVYKPIKNWINKINDILKEFRPNGGNSLKDAIDRIELRLLILNQRQKIIDIDSIMDNFIDTENDIDKSY